MISASWSARLRPAEGRAMAGSCKAWAAAMPGASSTFESTTAISAPGRRCSLIALAMARKFEPLPERRMPRRCMKNFLSLIVGEVAWLIGTGASGATRSKNHEALISYQVQDEYKYPTCQH